LFLAVAIVGVLAHVLLSSHCECWVVYPLWSTPWVLSCADSDSQQPGKQTLGQRVHRFPLLFSIVMPLCHSGSRTCCRVSCWMRASGFGKYLICCEQ